MSGPWRPDLNAEFKRRFGQSPEELGNTKIGTECPDIWELDNGDVVVIGRDVTDAYQERLPSGVIITAEERLVMIPGNTLASAKREIPDA